MVTGELPCVTNTYKEKEKPYLLIMILGELVLYRDGIINLEIELIQIDIKG